MKAVGLPEYLLAEVMNVPLHSTTIAVRSDVLDERELPVLLARMLRDIAPGLAIRQLASGYSLARQGAVVELALSWLCSMLGVGMFLIASTGLYGSVRLIVGASRREIGIRIALGATTGSVIRLILRRGLQPVLIGLVCGVSIAALLRLSVTRFFVAPVSATEGLYTAGGSGLLLGLCIVACYPLVRQTVRSRPVDLLR